MKGIIKIGNNKGRSRLWIEGTKLKKHGFDPDVKYNLTYDVYNAQIIIAQHPEGSRKVSRRKKDNCPIIDISDMILTQFLQKYFPKDKVVSVIFRDGIITINRIEA